MNLKFVIFWALLAYVSAANLPKPAMGDLREAFETEDSLYIPISDQEAEQLRLPRSSHIPKRKIPNFEINGASDDWEAEKLRLPRDIPDIELHHKHKRPRRQSEKACEIDESNDDPQPTRQGNREPPEKCENKDEGDGERKLFIEGGGSPKQGYDIHIEGRLKLWESQNQRNSLHGTGSYNQHLGGSFGSSQPNFGGGLIFTHRF
ncbi:unnamed protein product [Hermetia illucens]|uniref:Attacin C-terminal domain-containing protein n=1 Tax=Hermetia illucens TaxID=343691 RepID=A0A7R8UHK7_HERIL|nr:uncharacterized protein LOC119648693 [Hermetia illucens]CAD7080682.1 unnamed protein product [Hermetia illucens]